MLIQLCYDVLSLASRVSPAEYVHFLGEFYGMQDHHNDTKNGGDDEYKYEDVHKIWICFFVAVHMPPTRDT